MFRSTLLSITTLLIFIAASGLYSDIVAQFQDEDYRKFSVSVHGGLTLPNNDSGLHLFGSNLNRVTNQTYNIGGGVQYALTPFWSIGGEYNYATIDGRSLFETEVHSFSIKNYFNFNRLYRRSSLSEYLNPFAMVGAGHDFFTYKSEDDRFSDNELSIRLGLGLAYNVTEAVEIFGQYNVHLGSNSFDNVNTGTPTDLLGMASGGVRVYFGNKNARRFAMAPATVNISHADYRDFRSTSEKLALMERQSDQKDMEIDSLRREMFVLENKLNSQIENLYENFSSYSGKINELEEELAAVRSEIEDTRVIRDEIIPGHYVQVFAATYENVAQDVRRQTILLLRDVIDNPESKVIITQRRQFYEVLIGGYDQFATAKKVRTSVEKNYNDAFVLTFARPYNLSHVYNDIKIIH